MGERKSVHRSIFRAQLRTRPCSRSNREHDCVRTTYASTTIKSLQKMGMRPARASRWDRHPARTGRELLRGRATNGSRGAAIPITALKYPLSSTFVSDCTFSHQARQTATRGGRGRFLLPVGVPTLRIGTRPTASSRARTRATFQLTSASSTSLPAPLGPSLTAQTPGLIP